MGKEIVEIIRENLQKILMNVFIIKFHKRFVINIQSMTPNSMHIGLHIRIRVSIRASIRQSFCLTCKKKKQNHGGGSARAHVCVCVCVSSHVIAVCFVLT